MLHTCTRSLASLAQAAGGSPFGGSAGPDLTRYFTVCGLLLGAILGLAWGFRKLMRGALQVRAAQRSLQVLDVLPLSSKHKLAVVRCYDRTFALGLGEREVGLIAELDPVVAPAPAAPRAEFTDALDRERVRAAEADAHSPQGALARVQGLLRRGGLIG